MPFSAIFLDRDGTINRELEYLHRIADFAYEKEVPQALQVLRALWDHLVVVTNQSGIGRGYYRQEQMDELNRFMVDDLRDRYDVAIDAIYHCPHHPSRDGECLCRKPLPGMLLQAAREHGIDLQRAWIIGDKDADILAGYAAGCQGGILVQTGHGREYDNFTPPQERPFAFQRCATLLEAARFLQDQ